MVFKKMLGRNTRKSAPGSSKGSNQSVGGSDDPEEEPKKLTRSSLRGQPEKPKVIVRYEEMELTDSDEEDQPIGKGEGAEVDLEDENNLLEESDGAEVSDDENSISTTPKNKKKTQEVATVSPKDSVTTKAKGTPQARTKPGPLSSKKTGNTGSVITKESKDYSDEDFEDEDEEDEEEEPQGTEKENLPSSEGEDENPEIPLPVDYSNDNWLDKVSKTCQVCKKKYETCRDASNCITGKHNRVRCYLCYTYYRSSRKLYQHYADVHRKLTSKEEAVSCPFCSQSVPLRSLSCHVITFHIATREAPVNDESESESDGKENAPGKMKRTRSVLYSEGEESDEENEENQRVPKRTRRTRSLPNRAVRGKKSSKTADESEDEDDADE